MPSSNSTGLHNNFNLSISNDIKLRKLSFYEIINEIQKPIRLMRMFNSKTYSKTL
jgi:hypothetical protein